MVKRIVYSVMFFIIFFVIFFVVSIMMQKFMFAKPNYMESSFAMSVGASIGIFMDYVLLCIITKEDE